MIYKKYSMKKRLEHVLRNTEYKLVFFKYDSKSFGNIIIQISGYNQKLNITSDRGDIYMNDKGVYFGLESPLLLDPFEIIIAILIRDYLIPLKREIDLSSYDLKK